MKLQNKRPVLTIGCNGILNRSAIEPLKFLTPDCAVGPFNKGVIICSKICAEGNLSYKMMYFTHLCLIAEQSLSKTLLSLSFQKLLDLLPSFNKMSVMN